MDVDSSEPSVIDVSDFLPEFRQFGGGVIKMKPSHLTTHVKVHAGPHADLVTYVAVVSSRGCELLGTVCDRGF